MDQDIKAAGIPKKAFGGKMDFHALRVAHVSLGIEAGASVKDAQALARLATAELTLNTYVRTRDERLSQIAERIGCMVAPTPNYAAFIEVRRSNRTAEVPETASILEPTAASRLRLLIRGSIEAPRLRELRAST
jgi:hypothetical protein